MAQDTVSVVASLLDNLDSSEDQNCILVVATADKDEFGSFLDELGRQTLVLDLGSKASPAWAAEFLRNEVMCAIGLVGGSGNNKNITAAGSPLMNMLGLLSKVPKSKVLVSRTERPTMKEIYRHVNLRILYWTQWTTEVLYRYKLSLFFCISFYST